MSRQAYLFDARWRAPEKGEAWKILERLKEGGSEESLLHISEEEASLIIGAGDDLLLKEVINLSGVRIGSRDGAASTAVWWQEAMDRLAPQAIWSHLLDHIAGRGWIHKWNIEQLKRPDGQAYPTRPPREIIRELAPWVAGLDEEAILELVGQLGQNRSVLISNLVAETPRLTGRVLEALGHNPEIMCTVGKNNRFVTGEVSDWLWRYVVKGLEELYMLEETELDLLMRESGKFGQRVREGEAYRALARHLLRKKLTPPNDALDSLMSWAVMLETRGANRTAGIAILSREWVRVAARRVVTAGFIERTPEELETIMQADASALVLLMISERQNEPGVIEMLAGLTEGVPGNFYTDKYINRLVRNLATTQNITLYKAVRDLVKSKTGGNLMNEVWPKVPDEFKREIMTGWMEHWPGLAIGLLARAPAETLKILEHRIITPALNSPERETRVLAAAVGAKIARVKI